MSKSTSILMDKQEVVNILPDKMKEGIDYINIVKDSEYELGSKLSLGYPVGFKTVFGTIGTLRSGMDFISTPNYPVSLLSKKKLTKHDINTIPSKRITVPNYWSVVAYMVCSRVKADSDLLQLLKDNTLVLTSVNVKKTEDLGMFGSTYIPNYKMGRYLSIVRHISDMLKEDRFTDDDIKQFISDCRDDKDKDVFDGLPFEIKVKM